MFQLLLQASTASPIDAVDLTTWAGIATAVTVIISFGKSFAPKLFVDRERIAAALLGVILATVSKLSGIGFHDVQWVTLVLVGIGAGPAAGVLYKHGTKAMQPAPTSESANDPRTKP